MTIDKLLFSPNYNKVMSEFENFINQCKSVESVLSVCYFQKLGTRMTRIQQISADFLLTNSY